MSWSRPASGLGLLLLVAALVPPPVAAQQPAPSPGGAPFTSFGYGETDIRGGVGRADIFLPLARDTKAAGETVLDLDISHSPLLVAPSTLTVLAGGVAVASVALDAGNLSHGRLPVRVPAELFAERGLALSIRTFLRLTEDDCEDPDNPALWATVHGTSTAQLSTQPLPRDLRDAADLLVRPRDGDGVSFALPPSPGADMLRAAGIAAAQIGRWQALRHQDALVGLAGSTGEADVSVSAGTTPPGGEHGFVSVAQDGPARLVLGGATAAAAVEAAEALGAPLAGPSVALTGVRPAPVVDEARPWQDGGASFAQLGIDRQDLTGLGTREVAVQIDRPPGWTIKGRPTLDLMVEVAPGLDSNQSSMQVQLAGVDLGSRRLEAGAGPRAYRFDIPAGLIDRTLDGRAVRSLDLTVRMVLQAPHERCMPFNVEAARATILPTSSFRLPHDDFGGRELARFPHPLAGPVLVVLPTSPDPATVAAGLQVSAAIGRWTDAGAPPPVLTTADRVDRATADDQSLVLLGNADQQLLGQAVDIGRGTVVTRPGEASAVMAVVPSPLDASETVLVVHGDAAGLLLAARTLGSRASLAELRGSRVALGGAMPAVTLTDIARPSPPPELAPVVGGRAFTSENPWVVPSIVVGAGFLAALLLVVRYRWARPGRKAAG